MHHYIDEARKDADFSRVRRVGIDETASRRGHNYISLFVDLDEKRLLLGTEGKGAGTVHVFKEDLRRHGGEPSLVSEVCCDMSPAFISGVSKAFPEADITFDRFYIMKLMQEAVDQSTAARSEDNCGTQEDTVSVVEEPGEVNRASTDQAEPSEPPQAEDRAGVPYQAYSARVVQPTGQASGRGIP